jgi:hypothetical protein
VDIFVSIVRVLPEFEFLDRFILDVNKINKLIFWFNGFIQMLCSCLLSF